MNCGEVDIVADLAFVSYLVGNREWLETTKRQAVIYCQPRSNLIIRIIERIGWHLRERNYFKEHFERLKKGL